jgi:NhaP-type Na+/H+ or K+/H+ antiporter
VQALVQAETLFNDATSLVLFQIAVSFAVTGTAGPAGGVVLHGTGEFAVLVIVAGLVIGGRRERITTAQTRLQLHSVYRHGHLPAGKRRVQPDRPAAADLDP